ncbi:MAG: tetratricopeptide repeat protein [Rubrobacteraceae bacterium]
MQNGDGFVLQGPPTDGKSRTLYEIIPRMKGYEVLRPKIGEVPTEDGIRLLLKGHKAVLLLDDLTNYVGAQLNLRELGERLDRCSVEWAVASTCRDGPELESVRDSETGGLKKFYEDIPKKLKLLELAPEEKEELAHSIGNEEWSPERSGHYPTPGSITMEGYKRFMHERFDGDLSSLEKDTLRALKLLSRAGILPLTHRRIEALLKEERLFNRHDFHLRDCLDNLRERSFLRPSSVANVVLPEPAYLADDVVSYLPGRHPERDFYVLKEILEDLQDYEGLFYLGNTYFEQERCEQAIEAYDAALEIRPDDAEALYNKIVALLGQEKEEEAIEQLCQGWRNREHLSDGGASLSRIFEILEKNPQECE